MSRRGCESLPEPKSTLYVTATAFLSAAILGLTIFLLIRGLQWRAAFADLRAEPGIEILSVERVGFFKKRLRGLRDPLAPAAETILQKHRIGPHSAELILTEYHSLNTPYSAQRDGEGRAHLEEVRLSLYAAVGEFAESLNRKREKDLEKITQMLFETRFPEAMESVSLEWRDGAWFARGELYAPQYEQFVAEAPDSIVEGELHFSQLVNLTEARTSSLRQEIESTNLFTEDIDGNFVHLERIKRLLGDYDLVCEHSGLSLPRLRLEISRTDLASEQSLLERLRTELLSPPAPEETRWLPEISAPTTEDGTPFAFLKLLPAFAP